MTERHPSTVFASGPIPSIGRKNSASSGNCSFEPGHAVLDIRIPTTPQHAAGDRIDPPKSPPQSNAAIPVAIAAAPPPVLPPAVRDASKGLLVAPTRWLSVSVESARSGMFDLPR